MPANIANAILSAERLGSVADRDAILCGASRLSYRELADRAARAGAVLRRQGLAPGQRMVVQARDTEAQATVLLGAMAAGLVPVILSPRVSTDDRHYVMAETEAALVVRDEDTGDGGPVKTMGLEALAAAPAVDGEPVPKDIAATDEGVRPGTGAATEAFWLYSSGTTGRMKGVVHGHHDLAPVVAYHRDVLGVGPGTRTFCTSRVSFAYAMSNGFLAPLALGATIVLQPDWPTPRATLETIAATRPDVVFSVPSLYRGWLELPADALAPLRDVGAFVSAGEALPVAVAERWHAATGRPILDCYGCSETCFLTFASPLPGARPGAVGFPCTGVETELRDEAGAKAEPGKAGRLFIRHPFLALGYGRYAPAEARARFSDGWFATGDVFLCDEEGYWHHYGREDDWLKIAGQWVSLRGVEETAGAFDGVDQAVAVTAKDGNGFLRVALFVVPRDNGGGAWSAPDLEGFLAERLPAFKRPKWTRLIDDLPRTTTGKVRKADLRRLIEEEAR